MCAVTFYDMYKHKCCFIDSVSCGQLRTDHGARARPVLVLRTRSSLNEHAASIALGILCIAQMQQPVSSAGRSSNLLSQCLSIPWRGR